MLNGLDLFSGIGGLSIALQDWVKPIVYCEIEPYCQAILLNRMYLEHIFDAPIWDDVCTFAGKGLYGSIDIIYGGFPCQDISIAGFGRGLEGKRSGLFFEIVRLANEIQPKFIFLENVPAITSRGGLHVVKEITEMGYDCRWCIISAERFGAPHKRNRWFLLAKNKKKFGYLEEEKKIMANTRFKCKRCLQKSREKKRTSFHSPGCSRFWEIEPDMDRVANGIPKRLDRIRALGNAVVPQQAREAFKILMGIN